MHNFRYLLRVTNKAPLNQAWRQCASMAEVKAESSQRAKEWRAYQQKYENYPHILYSSHLDQNVDLMPTWRRKSLDYKLAKDQRRKQKEEKLAKPQESPATTPRRAVVNDCDFPLDWMEDYEFYAGASEGDLIKEESEQKALYGTADPHVPPSSVPCNGCGAHLHCQSTVQPGYIPKEIFKGRTKEELQTIICQRCHFLKHYNIALDLEVSPESYVETISAIQERFALAIVMVDLLDFPCSLWPDMQKLLGPKRPVFVVGNKVDLLPRDRNSYLDHVKRCLKDELLRCGFDALNIKNVSLISAKTGYGIEELITQLQKIWFYKGDVYLMGCTNVGKSSLFNILLNSDYCRPEATDLVRKATTCPWPGTTLQMLKFPIMRPSEIRVYHRFRRLFSERGQKAALEQLRRIQARETKSIDSIKPIGAVGRTYEIRGEEVVDAFAVTKGVKPVVTLNENRLEYQKAKWCYDTPGVMQPEQITNLLTTEELAQLEPPRMISPRALRLKIGMTAFLGGLGRVDLVDYRQTHGYDWIQVYFFGSPNLPIVIGTTAHADELYEKYLGTEILGLPFGTKERLARWPGLTARKEDFVVSSSGEDFLQCDITLSSAGWMGVNVPDGSECVLRVWTPNSRGIYLRTPALIPHAARLIGKRIRHSLAYSVAKPFSLEK